MTSGIAKSWKSSVQSPGIKQSWLSVLHYISCPEAADEFSKETMKRQIREVIQEMLADGSLSGLAAPPAAHEQEPENADDLSDMMAAFRGG